MPTISVVTICFNNLEDLKKTCASVEAQTIWPYEHWIINGSTNNDIEKWLENNPQPPFRKWINEPDKGIADAFNKGISNSQGEVIHILNAGDTYKSEDILVIVTKELEQYKDVLWISGKIRTKRSGHWIEIGKPFDAKKLYRGMRSISHPTWFVYKSVYNRVGAYNNLYKIGMDYDMLCRISKEPYRYLPLTIACFDDTGISSNNFYGSLKEILMIYETNFGYSVKCRLWQIRLRLIYCLLQNKTGKVLYSLKKKMRLENV